MEDNTIEAVEVGPFDAMSKADMIDHITSAHGIGLHSISYTPSKITKDDLLRWHTAEHKGIVLMEEHDWPNTMSTEVIEGLRDIGVRRRPQKPAIPHEHVEVPLSDAAAAAYGVLTTQRDNTPIAALNATERKALKDVVDNDFGILKQEIRAMAADLQRQRLAEVEAEFKEKQGHDHEYLTKAQDLIVAWRLQARELIEEARAAGVTLHLDFPGYHPRVEAAGYEQARRAASDDTQREMERALLTLERQRLTAQRQVLLTGVSGEVAQAVLGSIPDAKTLMVAAAKETVHHDPVDLDDDDEEPYDRTRDYDVDPPRYYKSLD